MQPLPEYITVPMRSLHILAAMTSVGGTFFILFVLLPAQSALQPEEQQRLHAALRKRWSKVIAIAIAGLTISGLINFGIAVKTYRLPMWYHGVFGVKFLVAMAIFVIASLLASQTEAGAMLRKNLRFWVATNALLAVAIVLLSATLRFAPRTPISAQQKSDEAAPTAGVESNQALR